MTKVLEPIHSQGNALRDLILGGQDGLVNVLGIVLGVTAASGSHQVIIVASLAAAFAEAVSMGAVAYTSQLAQKDFYEKEREREYREVSEVPEKEREEIRQIYRAKGFDGELLEKIVERISSQPDVWVANMMSDELQLSEVATKDVFKSSLLVGVSALVGSFFPIVPFFLLGGWVAVAVSLVVSALVLFAVGAYKAKTMVGVWWKSGFQMLLIGMGAAVVGFLIGHLFGTA